MKQIILKRHGNYILRTKRHSLSNVIYTWHFSKELSNILKEYNKIEEWQYDNIKDNIFQMNYSFSYIRCLNAFKDYFKIIQEKYISELVQKCYKTGKHADKM